jgi:tetratricopeptide (TPR) repeat protein
MALSIAAKQNYIYIIFVILTSIGSIFLYRTTQQTWIIFREAETKYSNKDYREAIVLYKKSLETGLPFYRVVVNLANSYVAIGNFKEAIVLYKNYLLENPKDTNVRLELARALSYVGNFEESEIEYKKTLEDTHESH